MSNGAAATLTPTTQYTKGKRVVTWTVKGREMRHPGTIRAIRYNGERGIYEHDIDLDCGRQVTRYVQDMRPE